MEPGGSPLFYDVNIIFFLKNSTRNISWETVLFLQIITKQNCFFYSNVNNFIGTGVDAICQTAILEIMVNVAW